MLLSGCGAPNSQPKPVLHTNKPERKQAISTGQLELIHRDQKHQRLWSIEAQKSHIHYSNQGKTVGEFYQAKGVLFEKDQKVSTFQADKAIADQFKNTLVLEGNVLLVAEKSQVTLKAKQAFWEGAKRELKAMGNVYIESPDYFAGPFNELVTDPDFNHIDTPDHPKEQP